MSRFLRWPLKIGFLAFCFKGLYVLDLAEFEEKGDVSCVKIYVCFVE